jgi:phage tail-like protein
VSPADDSREPGGGHGRGTVDGYPSPWPLIDNLPGLYQEDELARELTRAFDEVLAPAIGALDNFTAYLDPALTPEDFLDWLAGWVGLLPDENWPIERRRAIVALAAQLYRNRGTVKGLQMHIKLFASGDVEVIDNGAAAWSSTPDAAVPGQPDFGLLVRIKPTRKGSVDKARLDALVAAAKPAHVPHTIEIVDG